MTHPQGLKPLSQPPSWEDWMRVESPFLVYPHYLNNLNLLSVGWEGEGVSVQLGKIGDFFGLGFWGTEDASWSHLSQRPAQSSGPTPPPSDPLPRARVNHAKGRGQPVCMCLYM